MLDKLFASSTLADLLVILLTHPEREYYINELVRLTGRFPRSIHLAVRRLEGLELVKTREEANLKYVRANQDHPIYPELKSIVFKTVGLGDALREALGSLGRIERAFIYGSVAKNVEGLTSDVDLMIIGEIDPKALTECLDKVERRLNREVNYVIFSPAEWQARLEGGNPFVKEVEKSEKIPLIGG